MKVKDEIYKCECGGITFGITRACRGTFYQSFNLINGKSEIQDGCGDSMYLGPQPKTMICEHCMKRQPNPNWK